MPASPSLPEDRRGGTPGLPPVTLLGPSPFARDDAGAAAATHIGSAFPSERTLVTLPGIHATQRLALLARRNEERRAAGRPDLSPAEEETLLQEAVDLIFDGDQILIRPDPSRLDLAFAADEMLGEIAGVSRRDIRFLFVVDPKVRDAVQARGECWRISRLPQSPDQAARLITASRSAIQEGPIYYYARFTGTRLLTCEEFGKLAALDDGALARQLAEIAAYSRQRNRRGRPEIDFFGVEAGGFGAADFPDADFAALPPSELRTHFGRLHERFRAAVAPELRRDDPAAETWRRRLLAALLQQHFETTTDDLVTQLSPEFFQQVEWLPGGRSEEGEFILDPVFDELERGPQDEELRRLCDPLVRGFIFNYLRDYGNVEYINIGRIGHSLSRVRPQVRGRRGVYLVQLKLQDAPAPLLRFIRMQKWGIRERLDEGKPLLQAMLENEEYSDYVLDRRLGLRQLGMNLPPRIRVLRTREVYHGLNREVAGQEIPVLCFERDYVSGVATDKVSALRYQQAGYAGRLASLLGRAAAINLIVGRAAEPTKQVVFDDGDEVIIEDPATGLPREIIISDPSGSFCDYLRPLAEVAAHYARPVNTRASLVPAPRDFAEAYLAAFHERFLRVQSEYRKRRRAFDHLFKHCRRDPGGSFAYRWECVLQRLDATDAATLTGSVRAQVECLRLPDHA